MLKITVHRTDHSTRLTLEGRLAGPWVQELERSWRNIKASSTDSLVVDLMGVTFIEPGGKTLLTQMCREGAELLAAGCCMKPIVEDIRQSAEVLTEKRKGRKNT